MRRIVERMVDIGIRLIWIAVAAVMLLVCAPLWSIAELLRILQDED